MEEEQGVTEDALQDLESDSLQDLHRHYKQAVCKNFTERIKSLKLYQETVMDTFVDSSTTGR